MKKEKDGITRRGLLRAAGFGTFFLHAGVLGGAFYAGLSPKADTDPLNPAAPSPLQREFLALCAERYEHLCLGDTNHTKYEISNFGVDPELVARFARAGKKRFFMELPEGEQSVLDAGKTLDPEEFSRLHANDLQGSWSCDPNGVALHAKILSRAIQNNKGIAFHAIDGRQADMGEGFSKFFASLPGQAKVEIIAAILFIVGYNTVYGCISEKALDVASKIITDEKLSQSILSVLGEAVDDTVPAQKILKLNEPSVLFYGSGHFKGLNTMFGKKGFPDIFKENGKTFCVAEILNKESDIEAPDTLLTELKKAGGDDEAVKKMLENAVLREPDCQLFVYPGSQYPDGIRINNPALLPLYEEAKRRIAQAGPTPARPLAL